MAETAPLRLIGTAAALCGVLALAGCGAGAARTFGMVRDPPDEFEVTTRAPLVVPPDFSLPPPRPGAERPQEQSPRLQAEAALVPAVELNAGGADSPGQQALVRAAGPPAPANIRQTVDKEAANDTGGGVTDTLMFWKSTPPPGKVIDPQREAARLHQPGNRAGAAAPPPAKSAGGLLDWLF